MKYLLTFILAVIAIQPAMAQEPPVVVELFTSQSCSSCPPADRLLSEWQDRHDNIIALSCHVTYWNHLHWRDTLSKQFCTDRQRWYSDKLGKGIFTPQMVINGAVSAVGSRRSQAIKALGNIEETHPIRPLSYQRDGNDIRLLNLPRLDRNNHILLLFTYSKHHAQHVPSGENAGRDLQYTNPVSAITILDGNPFSLPGDDGTTGHAVILQNRETGAVIAATQLYAN